ncbi:MAG: hypothetical protein R2795_07590 [Saprospiraceae bacterium]
MELLADGYADGFVYAKLWRRSGILTDLEFYELRYSGKPASFLRGFRAVYLGVVFNVMIMATVSLAAIKIGGVLLGLTPLQTVVIASIVTVVYTSLGGLRGVIITDFFQFILAMVGMVWAAVVVLNRPDIQGLDGLLSHEALQGKLNFLPDFNNWEVVDQLFIIPLAVQWWSVWYPGAEPGGGGYIVQRMLAAKDEKHAIGATLLFNITHYALRPWPWLLIALASLVYFPMTVKPEAGNKVYVRADADSFLDSHLHPDALPLLTTQLEVHTQSAQKQTDIADLQRLTSIVAEHPEALEVKSLAYIYYEKTRK